MTTTYKDCILHLQKKNPIIIFDSENENEGDLIYPAEIINVEILNFMLNNCKGVICQTLKPDIIKKLEIPIFTKTNNNLTGQTNFIYPVDHINSETGISSKDRAMIIKELVSSNSNKKNLVIPGHQSLLKISESGLLTRQGHTESSSEIIKTAGYTESAVICEIIGNDGVPLRYDSILRFSEKHNIPVILLNDIYKNFLDNVKINPSIKIYKNPYYYLANKTIILSGGSSGIGKSLKNNLLKYDCTIIDLSRSYGHDITNYDTINKFIDDNIKNIDILINCAGYIEPCSIEAMSLNEWNKHINTNLTGIFNLTNQLIPKFTENCGVIINITSPCAKKTRNKWSAYCCTKAALHNFTMSCSEELKEKNIKVNGISPSKTDTPMIHRLFENLNNNDLIQPDIISNTIINIICSSIENGTTGTIYDVTK